MIFFRILELATILAIVWAISTQVVIPAWRNKPLFPIFRRTAKLQQTLNELDERESELNLSEQVRARAERLAKRQPRNRTTQ